MKRHATILAAGALALTAGLFVTVKTADDANAAPMKFNPAPQTMKFQAPKQNFQKFNTQKTFTKQKFIVPKQTFTKHKFVPKQKFANPKFSPTKFTPTKFTPTKFSKFPKGVKVIGISSLGPKAFKGPNLIKGPNLVGPIKLLPKGPNLTLINNKNFTIWRGPRGIWWNGRMRTLVALTVLGGVTIGSVYYLADGYVPIAYPVCRGITVEGCSLVWRDVPTEDGDVIAQCVQFCPRVPTAVSTEAPAPAGLATAETRAAAAPVPPDAMAQGCTISIHGDPNFDGVKSEVTADQPQLAMYGWDKAISSIQVKSGTWDFYTDDNYGGQMIRLAPGQYPTLAQGWDKTINSLMCAQP